MLTNEQKQLHKEKLSASMAATALGLNPFESPLEYWAKLTGRIEWDDEENDAMCFGHTMEPVIAEMFAKRTGFRIEQNDTTYIYDMKNWLIGTPDYFSRKSDDFGLEIKNVGPNVRRYWGTEDDPNGVPAYVMPQVATYSLMTGIPKWYVAAYFGGSDFRVYEFTFEKPLLEKLLKRLEAFWTLVETQTPPEATHKDLDLLRDMYGGHEDVEIKVCDEDNIHKYIEQYPDYLRDLADAKKYIDLCKARIQAYMGEATKLIDSAGKPLFTWRRSKDKKPKTDWMMAFYDIVQIKGVDAAECHKIENKHTNSGGPGNRPFLCKFKDEDEK